MLSADEAVLNGLANKPFDKNAFDTGFVYNMHISGFAGMYNAEQYTSK